MGIMKYYTTMVRKSTNTCNNTEQKVTYYVIPFPENMKIGQKTCYWKPTLWFPRKGGEEQLQGALSSLSLSVLALGANSRGG